MCLEERLSKVQPPDFNIVGWQRLHGNDLILSQVFYVPAYMYVEDLYQGAFSISLKLTMSAPPINKDNPPDGVLGNQQSTLTAELGCAFRRNSAGFRWE